MADESPDDRFITPLKFTGGVFERPGFPMERLAELAAYRELLIETAKVLWRETHPGKKRLPKGFAESITLSISTFRDGSSLPMMLKPEHSQTELEIAGTIDQSISRVDDLFWAIVNDLGMPDWTTEDIEDKAKHVGGSLTDDERLILRPSSPEPIHYGVRDRDQYLLRLEKRKSTVRAILIGSIRMLDVKKKFSAMLADSRTVEGAFTNQTIFDDLHKAHSIGATDLLWLDCDFTVTAGELGPSAILDVYAAGPFSDRTSRWVPRLARIASVPDGGLEEGSIRVAADTLSAALSLLDALVEAGLPEPAIYADEEGGVRLEWVKGRRHTTVIMDDELKAAMYHVDLDSDADVEREGIVGVADTIEALRGVLDVG